MPSASQGHSRRQSGALSKMGAWRQSRNNFCSECIVLYVVVTALRGALSAAKCRLIDGERCPGQEKTTPRRTPLVRNHDQSRIRSARQAASAGGPVFLRGRLPLLPFPGREPGPRRPAGAHRQAHHLQGVLERGGRRVVGGADGGPGDRSGEPRLLLPHRQSRADRCPAHRSGRTDHHGAHRFTDHHPERLDAHPHRHQRGACPAAAARRHP